MTSIPREETKALTCTLLPSDELIVARRIILGGRVQGVGFRPFVYQTAYKLGVHGWVCNRGGEVEIVAQGSLRDLERFRRTLLEHAPPFAHPLLREDTSYPVAPLDTFRIQASLVDHPARIHVPPDQFTCNDCLLELQDTADRRYRYPFINCTQCGPRYTLIRRLPYDRPNTSMAGFALCADCRREYGDPHDRRFHAEPVACPVCGPQAEFRSGGDTVTGTEAALAACSAALCRDDIVAVKGIGGYHLMCNAGSDAAVARLRALKPRPHKPLAVMFPVAGTDGLDAVRTAVVLDTTAHADALLDAARPVVLARRRANHGMSKHIAPGLDELGVFLPYSPLHHLLLSDFRGPLVATSANISGEPVLTDAGAVEERLAHVAQAFLHHDRPIQRPADDPVLRVISGRPRPLRLGRGLTPLELDLPFRLTRPLLALGGHMKNTVALAWEDRVVISPHIGDLDTPRSLDVFAQVIVDLQALYGVRAQMVVHDAHPAYASTHWARDCGLPVTAVFHHYAHAAGVAGEYPRTGPWLIFTWDGVGYGADGCLWGGEALLGRPGDWRRVATLRPFRPPGGDRAGREPWRSAAALCWETGQNWADCPVRDPLVHESWVRGINCPPTSAVGRLFDAAAALTGLVLHASYEGQAPMRLEAACTRSMDAAPLPLGVTPHGVRQADWAPLLPMLLDATLSAAERAVRFHATLAATLIAQACAIRESHGEFAVGLSGGVFQNRVLAEAAIAGLEQHGFEVFLPQRVPVNDGGLCFGQIIETANYGNSMLNSD